MTKVPVWNRDLLADMLGMDETLIRVHAVDAGGGFGVRGEFYPEDFLIPWLAAKTGPPGQVGRGPGRAPDGGEPLPPAVPPHRRRLRRRRPDPGPGRRHHPGQRRLLPHPRRRGARTHRRHAARPLPGARLPGPGAGGAHQQDPVRHLPGAGPVRGHGGARAPARRGRHPARHRSDRAADAEPPRAERDAARAPDQHPRHRADPGHRRLPGPARGRGQGGRPARLPHRRPRANARGCQAPRLRAGHVRGEERPRAAGDRRRDREQVRRRARLLRRDLDGPGHRDRARADHRGRPRRRPADRACHRGGYGRPAVRRRVLGVPVDRGGRQRGAPGRARGPGAGAAAGRADAGGRRGGPRPGRRVGHASAATRT